MHCSPAKKIVTLKMTNNEWLQKINHWCLCLYIAGELNIAPYCKEMVGASCYRFQGLSSRFLGLSPECKVKPKQLITTIPLHPLEHIHILMWHSSLKKCSCLGFLGLAEKSSTSDFLLLQMSPGQAGQCNSHCLW